MFITGVYFASVKVTLDFIQARPTQTGVGVVHPDIGALKVVEFHRSTLAVGYFVRPAHKRDSASRTYLFHTSSIFRFEYFFVSVS